jgi:hypothetical protein
MAFAVTFLNMLFSHQSGLWWKMLERAYLYIMLNGFTSQHNQHPKSPYLFTLQPRMFFMWCEARSGQRQALFESTKVECAPSRLENLESTWWGREGHRSFRAYRAGVHAQFQAQEDIGATTCCSLFVIHVPQL